MIQRRADREAGRLLHHAASPARGATWPTTVWEEIEDDGEQGTLGLLHAGGRALDRRPAHRRRAAQRMAEVAADHSDDWRDLGVAILHRLVIDTLLGAKDLPKPTYVHLVDEVIEELESGEFPLAALVMPATLDHIESVSTTASACRPRARISIPSCSAGW